ncbi:hypothetical protein K456DRAFT_905098 [Colletotrichum gloeosporioides 23]|nr:hypothetical protein K456DRAFT_905098 [Colletotrichum gloeosporioides 23]
MCTLESRCKPPAHGTRHAPPPPFPCELSQSRGAGSRWVRQMQCPRHLADESEKKVLLESLVAGEGGGQGVPVYGYVLMMMLSLALGSTVIRVRAPRGPGGQTEQLDRGTRDGRAVGPNDSARLREF